MVRAVFNTFRVLSIVPQGRIKRGPFGIVMVVLMFLVKSRRRVGTVEGLFRVVRVRVVYLCMQQLA